MLRRYRVWATAALAVALAVSLATPVIADDGGPLSEGDAQKALKRSAKSLKRAANALEQDNTDQAAEHLAQYSQTMSGLSGSLESQGIEQGDLGDVIDRVDTATFKHETKLLELLETAPEQALPGLTKALEASRMGRQRANEALLRQGAVELPTAALDHRSARAANRANNALLRQAGRAEGRGDTAIITSTVGLVAENTSLINQAIASGAIDQRNAISVLERVNSNTRRQAAKLEGLLETVPEQAWPAIERAIEQSARGQQEASAALARSRAASTLAGYPGVGGRPSGVGGGSSSSAGAGRPGSTPGGGASSGRGGTNSGRRGPPL